MSRNGVSLGRVVLWCDSRGIFWKLSLLFQNPWSQWLRRMHCLSANSYLLNNFPVLSGALGVVCWAQSRQWKLQGLWLRTRGSVLLEEVRKGHLGEVHRVKSKGRGQKGPGYCRLAGLKLAQPMALWSRVVKAVIIFKRWNYWSAFLFNQFSIFERERERYNIMAGLNYMWKDSHFGNGFKTRKQPEISVGMTFRRRPGAG